MAMSKSLRYRARAVVLSLSLLASAAARAGNSGTDPTNKHAWAENVGWADAGPTNHELTVHYDEGAGGWLSGHIWAENIGWVAVGSVARGPYGNTAATNWGVNLAADGKLNGYAWGENVGWITFEQTHGAPLINPDSGVFAGYAWGENVGWIKFRGGTPLYRVRTQAFDRQPRGTPNYWLDRYGVTEDYDAGDGVQAADKYVMDVDPTVAGNDLRITSITFSSAGVGTLVSFTPSSMRRYYTLNRLESLAGGGWSNVSGQVNVPGTSVGVVLTDAGPTTGMYYHVQVAVTPAP